MDEIARPLRRLLRLTSNTSEFVVMGDEKERLSRKLIKSYREKQISCSPGNVKPLADTFSKRGLASVELMTPSLAKMASVFIMKGTEYRGANRHCPLS